MDRLESKRLRLLIKGMSKELKLFQKTNNVQFRDPYFQILSLDRRHLNFIN